MIRGPHWSGYDLHDELYLSENDMLRTLPPKQQDVSWHFHMYEPIAGRHGL